MDFNTFLYTFQCYSHWRHLVLEGIHDETLLEGFKHPKHSPKMNFPILIKKAQTKYLKTNLYWRVFPPALHSRVPSRVQEGCGLQMLICGLLVKCAYGLHHRPESFITVTDRQIYVSILTATPCHELWWTSVGPISLPGPCTSLIVTSSVPTHRGVWTRENSQELALVLWYQSWSSLEAVSRLESLCWCFGSGFEGLKSLLGPTETCLRLVIGFGLSSGSAESWYLGMESLMELCHSFRNTE